MSSGDPGLDPDAARGQQLADWREKADAERAEMRRAISTLTQALSLLLPAPPPAGQPVPQALADAVDGPRSAAPTQVPLTVRGRGVVVWVTGGSRASAVQTWLAVLEAVPEEAASGALPQIRPLPAGLLAIRDGSQWTVPAGTSGADRKALGATLRRARTAGIAVPAAAWAVLRPAGRLHLMASAVSAVRSHVPATAAGAAATAAGIVLVFHPPAHGGLLPRGAALAPAVSTVSPPLAGSRDHQMGFVMPGGGAGDAPASPAAAGGNPGAGSRAPAEATPGIPVTWPGSPAPVTGITSPPVPPLVPGLEHLGHRAGDLADRTVHRVARTVKRTADGAAGLLHGLGHKTGAGDLSGLGL